MQAAGGNPDVRIHAVPRERLRDVEQVQTDGAESRRPVVAVAASQLDAQLHVPPHVPPLAGVLGERPRERVSCFELAPSGGQRLRDRRIAAGEHRGSLLDDEWDARLRGHLPRRTAPARSVEGDRDGVARHARARGDGDAHARLRRLDHHPAGPVVLAALLHPEVTLPQGGEGGDVVVDDGAADGGDDAEPARPVDGREDSAEVGAVGMTHRQEPLLVDVRTIARGTLDEHLAQQQPPPHVEDTVIVDDARSRRGGCVRWDRMDPQRKPIGKVDDALVDATPPPDHGRQAVVEAGDIRAGIVPARRAALRWGAARGDVAVRQRHQHLVDTLLRRIGRGDVQLPRALAPAAQRTRRRPLRASRAVECLHSCSSTDRLTRPLARSRVVGPAAASWGGGDGAEGGSPGSSSNR